MQLLGVCSGIQLEKNYQREKIYKFSEIEIDNNNILFKNRKRRIEVYFQHIDSFPISQISKKFNIIGIGDKLVTAVSMKNQSNHFGLLFHPETSGDIGVTIINNFLNI